MEARVVNPFIHRNTGTFWREGDTFVGDDSAIRQLAAKGYLRVGDEDVREDVDLAALTVAELRSLCEERGVEVPKRVRKADLLARLRG